MDTVSERVVVPFAGEGSGVGELSWGQREFWMAIQRTGSWWPIGGVAALPPGRTVADVAGELAYLLSRYQSLRTTLRWDIPDRPWQMVHASGQIELEVVDAGAADPAAVAAAVHHRYTDTPMDFQVEWPVRMGVVRRRGRLTHLVVAMSHLATDAFGAQVMLREVAVRQRAPVTGLTPLDQARWQHSPAGRRQNQAALRHYESILRTVAPRRYPPSRRVEPQPTWSGEFTSPATRRALGALTARTRDDPATIMLTAFAVAVSRVTGINPVVVRPLVSNRFRPGLADVVCSVVQSGLCVLDAGDAPFDEALARVKRAAMTMHKHAYHDPADFADLLAEVSGDRGTGIDLTCFFNNRRGNDGPALPDVSTNPPAESTFRWTPTDDGPIDRFFGRVEPDRDGAMRFSTLVDTNLMSLEDAEACLRGIETVTVEAAGLPVGTRGQVA
jgi:hypothetical protein